MTNQPSLLCRRNRRPQAFTALCYIAAPLMSIGRDARQVVSNPRAFIGGIAGAALVCAALAAAFTARPANAMEVEGPPLQFEPGVLTPLGIVYPQDVKVVTVDLQAVEVDPPEAVTKDDTPPPEVKDPPKPPKDPVKPPKDPSPPEPDVEAADTTTEANNPYPDPPTVTQNEGDPFGDANGWGELRASGDAWATQVMKALNAMSIPAWAANVPNGRYGFRIKVCRDGRITKVYTKSSSGNAGLDSAIKNELTRTRLPRMPASLIQHMSASCQTLNYKFTWGADQVR